MLPEDGVEVRVKLQVVLVQIFKELIRPQDLQHSDTKPSPGGVGWGVGGGLTLTLIEKLRNLVRYSPPQDLPHDIRHSSLSLMATRKSLSTTRKYKRSTASVFPTG
jgi:hypothetical protein